MQYKIDQSGKVEYTQKLTVVAYANGQVKSLLISAVEKRKLLVIMRALEWPQKIFIFKIFAGLVFLLIKDENIDSLIIDREYPGQEAFIRNIIVNLFRRINKEPPEINFTEIGKKVEAHKVALAIFQGKQKPDMVIKAKDVFSLFYFKKQKPRP